jgi:hypothetical protein
MPLLKFERHERDGESDRETKMVLRIQGDVRNVNKKAKGVKGGLVSLHLP